MDITGLIWALKMVGCCVLSLWLGAVVFWIAMWLVSLAKRIE